MIKGAGRRSTLNRYSFLLETYETERLKTVSVWSQFNDKDFEFRPEPRARTPHEHMVHQCQSEDLWMKNMLGITTDLTTLPREESRLEFIKHYAAAAGERLVRLNTMTEEWFEGTAAFFDVKRSRAWILTRRIAHSAHHRGQLMAYLRMLGYDLYSTYGPTADTGGLFQNHAQVIYRYPSIGSLIEAEERGGERPVLPGVGDKSATERPAKS
jgi:uncharacterized damage-inducible protein DinB